MSQSKALAAETPIEPSTATPDNRFTLIRAFVMHQQGELDQAESLYKEILQSEPQHFDALQLLATIAGQRGNSAEALALFEQVLNINPDHPETLNNRGNALRDLKRHTDALASYERAILVRPDYTEALTNRGNTLQELERHAEALESYTRALDINPDLVNALVNRGATLQKLARHAEALESYERANQLQPNCVETLYNRGIVLHELGRYDEALESYTHALQIKPLSTDILNNCGMTLCRLNRHAEALENYDRILNLWPDSVEALNNRGLVLYDLNRLPEALKDYDRALQLAPDRAKTHWNQSWALLLSGDFRNGWEKYEWRWKKEPKLVPFRPFSDPHWLGQESLANKTILLYSEQGLGDTLQFCRYVKQVAALGAKVILAVQPPLVSLLKNLEGAAIVLGTNEPIPDFDYHCPLLSLPLAFRTEVDTIDNAIYLKADPQQCAAWQAKLPPHSQKRIGLAWSGSVVHPHDHNRSIPLEKYNALLDDRARYYCLQKEIRPHDLASLKHLPEIHVFGNELRDFSDTAALVELMDIVITVDTSVAHLAGAMGKEVWILLAFNSEWRWLLKNRNGSPWYPSARLFRQSAIGDWEGLLGQVATELKLRLA